MVTDAASRTTVAIDTLLSGLPLIDRSTVSAHLPGYPARPL
jgi:hypothetical protein